MQLFEQHVDSPGRAALVRLADPANAAANVSFLRRRTDRLAAGKS